MKDNCVFRKISNIPYLLKYLDTYYNYMYLIFEILKGYYRDGIIEMELQS